MKSSRLIEALGTIGIAWAILSVMTFFAWNIGVVPAFAVDEITVLQAFMLNMFIGVTGKILSWAFGSRRRK